MGDNPTGSSVDYSKQTVSQGQTNAPNSNNINNQFMNYPYQAQNPPFYPYNGYPPFNNNQMGTAAPNMVNTTQSTADQSQKPIQQSTSMPGYSFPPAGYPYPYYPPQWPPLNNSPPNSTENNITNPSAPYPQQQPWMHPPFYPPAGTNFYGPYPPYPYPMNYPSYPYPIPYYNMPPQYMMGVAGQPGPTNMGVPAMPQTQQTPAQNANQTQQTSPSLSQQNPSVVFGNTQVPQNVQQTLGSHDSNVQQFQAPNPNLPLSTPGNLPQPQICGSGRVISQPNPSLVKTESTTQIQEVPKITYQGAEVPKHETLNNETNNLKMYQITDNMNQLSLGAGGNYSYNNLPNPPKLGIYPPLQSGRMITSSVRNEEEDVEYYSEENIPYLQEYIKKYEQLKEKTERFIDEEFPPKSSSLMDLMHSTKSVSWSGLEWLRPEEFFGSSDYKIFQKPETFEMEGSKYLPPLIEPNDIKQGELGNCYFLATLSSLAEWPKRVKRLFITRRKNVQGIYAVKMNHFGEWRAVIMDDYFPCYNRKRGPAFTKGNGNELWVLLLEKAWAKLYGSYERIEAGLTREALRDLTGAPTKVIFSDDKTLWEEISNGEKNNYIMTAGANEEEDLSRSTQDRLGLVASHAYSLISIHEISHPSRGETKLVKLRNPWGDKEWKGNWSDDSVIWTDELRKKLNYKKFNPRDGSFFMDFEDFKKYFSDIQICLYKDTHQYSSYRSRCSFKKATFFIMKVTQQGQYYITINQESKRKFERNSSYRYSMARIVIARLENNGSYVFMGAKQKNDKEVWIVHNDFTPGNYVIQVKIGWFDANDREFVLSSYGVDKVQFKESSKLEHPNFLEQVYLGRGRECQKRKNYGKYGLQEVEKAVELFEDEGVGYFYLRNRSGKKFRTTVHFTKMDGLKLRKPNRGNIIEISAEPGYDKVATLAVSYKGYSLSYTESIKF